MEIEKEVFRRCHPVTAKLKAYGFVPSEGSWLCQKDFMDGTFRAEVAVKDNEVKGRVIERELGEEYTNIYSDSHYGAFVSSVREAYIGILEDIRDHCFEKDLYLHEQTGRIVSYMKKEYGTKPEFLWKKYPEYAVFRNSENGRWYGIVMNIDGSKIGKKGSELEIINVKSDPHTIASLLNEEGFHEAYHMNKENWISVELNDTVDDEVLFSLIDYSYQMIEESDVWIVPANPKFYDVVGAFEKSQTIDWKQSSDIHVGDIVYLYVAAPYSAILYQCMAEEVDIPYSYQDRNLSISRLMKIRMLKKYPADRYPFSYLNSLGIRAVRGPRRIPKQIYEKLG